MSQFHQTRMGQDFFTHQLPQLVKAVKELTSVVKKQKPTQYPVCPSCANFDDGAYSHACTACIANNCGSFHFMKRLTADDVF